MKKLVLTLCVAMVTMLATVFAQAVIMPRESYFTITNKSNNDTKTISTSDFTNIEGLLLYQVSFDNNVYNGDQIEITYKPGLSFLTYQLTWFYGWLGSSSLVSIGSGLTKEVTVKDVPSSTPLNNTLLVQCDLSLEGSGTQTTYTFHFPSVHQESRVTAKNINASEVQVTYENYEEVSSGQRASTALYDIYGNLVSTGYLDGFGMSTLSTKGKSGIYIVKVIMNNQVIFNQRIQVK